MLENVSRCTSSDKPCSLVTAVLGAAVLGANTPRKELVVQQTRSTKLGNTRVHAQASRAGALLHASKGAFPRSRSLGLPRWQGVHRQLGGGWGTVADSA